MTPKKPDKPKRPIGPDEMQSYMTKDEASAGIESLTTTAAGGLQRKASVKKKSLVGGLT